ncbi:uncharacterized protein LY89DRAFT_85241 [Mollisia scopiformis]|uniref:Uncharacterized protein n=1 Tax=Mollisia scopiformis TaxID=149040 RepID=A0A194X8L7_MOLSC|nr:uncharacterized protein LY89DRAFT_85241 [Mollisia scopiformis]KUJ16518.1 hypothetical protein LY89DRAFT_85241 [Mollisia scopiformis]
MERDVGLQQGTCGSACNTTPDCRLCPRGRCFGGKCISTRGTALPLFGGFDVDGTVIAGFKKRSEETATTSDTATATSGQGSAVADDFSYNTKCNSTRDCKEELHSHCVDGRCVPTCMARDANCARGEAVMIEELVQDDRCILPCDHPEHCSPCDANVCRLGRCYLIRG